MIGSLTRIATVAVACALLSACGAVGDTDLTAADLAFAHAGHDRSRNADPERARGTTPNAPLDNPTLFPDGDSDPSTVEAAGLQCVPYARAHSGINLRGDAYTWWDKASGLYARGHDPLEGAVLVLNGYSKHRAHVAVVRRIVSPREIRIDHANWLDDGAVYVNDPVVDVSEANDWSQVKVWNIRSGSWGTRTYHVQGFIGPGPETGSPLVAAYHPAPKDDPIARTIAATSDDAATADSDSSDDDDLNDRPSR